MAMSLMNVPDVVQESIRHAQHQGRRRDRLTQQKPRGDVINDAKIMKLKDQILDSKQAVVKHILHSRTLQNNLNQIKIIDTALKNHLNMIQKSKFNQFKDLGKRISNLDQKIILQIEKITASEGYGDCLERSINSYNDDELCSVLNSLPGLYAFETLALFLLPFCFDLHHHLHLCDYSWYFCHSFLIFLFC